PSLQRLGVEPMAAHLFVFYFGALSGVTPPVALTTFAAAGIAGSKPWDTGWEAVKVGIASFVVPYMFVYRPELLWIGSPLNIIGQTLFALAGILSLAVFVQGYVFSATTGWERGLLGLAALLLIHRANESSILGLLCAALAVT